MHTVCNIGGSTPRQLVAYVETERHWRFYFNLYKPGVTQQSSFQKLSMKFLQL